MSDQQHHEQPLNPDDAAVLDNFAYVPDRDQALDHDHCFLCGSKLTEENRTDEHVFPRWVQREFDLYDLRMGLPNDTEIRYRQLTIPCCQDCNGRWLSQLEDEVSSAFRAGPDAFEALGPVTLGLWLSKIYYGLLFKDISLALDRSDPSSGPLLEPQWLTTYFELHQVLQVIRGALELTEDQVPASVFVFRTLDSEITANRFDFRDTTAFPFIALRLGPVGLVGCLLDWGSVAGALDIKDVAEAQSIELHPTQFLQVAALLAHWRIRFNRVPKYMIGGGSGDGPDQLITMPIGGLSGLPVFDEFEPDLYANLLAAFTGFPLDRVRNAAKKTLWNTLKKPDGSLAGVPNIEEYRFEPPDEL
ncbi:MAG TPA: hypothetical protein VIS51_08920 [Solirubrobacterales bacterium]